MATGRYTLVGTQATEATAGSPSQGYPWPSTRESPRFGKTCLSPTSGHGSDTPGPSGDRLSLIGRQGGLFEALQDAVRKGDFHGGGSLLSQHKWEAGQLLNDPSKVGRRRTRRLLGTAVTVKGISSTDRADLPELLRRLCGKGLAGLDTIGDDGHTALHAALRANNIAAVAALLDLGADPRIRDVYVKPDEGGASNCDDGDLPLHLAARFLRPCPANLLHRLCGQSFALLNMRGTGGWAALHIALRNGNPFTAATLLDRGADVHMSNEEGDMPVHLVHWCVEPSNMRECMPMLRRLCGKGYSLLNAAGAGGCTPLHSGLRNNRTTAALGLLEIGASISVCNSSGDMAIHVAAACVKPCTLPLMRRLAGKGLVLLNVPGTEGRTPIHAALRANSPGAAVALLELGADTAVRDARKDLSLHLAASHVKPCDVPLLRWLAGKGLNSRGYMGRTPLQAALSANNAPSATVLLDIGANVAIRDQQDDLALHIAARAVWQGTMGLFRLLAGPNLVYLNVVGADGCTPLHASLRANNPLAAGIVLDLGADETVRDGQGNMPIHLAASYLQPCTTALLQRLSGRGMLNTHGANDRTALHTALQAQNTVVAAALLELGTQAITRCGKHGYKGSDPSPRGNFPNMMYRNLGASLVGGQRVGFAF